MHICILSEDSKIFDVKETAKSLFSSDILKIPVSKTGNLPSTHWFCFMTCDEEFYNKLKGLQEHTIIEVSNPKEFLTKWNLKIIR